MASGPSRRQHTSLEEQPSRQTAEQWVLNWFEALETEARRVLREAGLPDQPGFIFQTSAGSLEFLPADLGDPIPKELLDRQEAGEGKITRWPNNLTIEELTPPYFARSVLFHLRDLSDELRRRQPDPWRVAKNALAIAHPYFCMSVEQSGLSDSALAGMKAREDAQGAALANKKIAAERRLIVDRLAREVLSEPGSAKRKSARSIAERIRKAAPGRTRQGEPATCRKSPNPARSHQTWILGGTATLRQVDDLLQQVVNLSHDWGHGVLQSI